MQFLNKNYCALRSIKYGNIYVTKLNFLQQINGKERLLSVFYCTFNSSRVYFFCDFRDFISLSRICHWALDAIIHY